MKSLSVKWGVILIGLAIFVHAEVWGADWKFIGKDSDGSVWEIDEASISRQPNNIVRVWVKKTESKKGSNDLVKELGEKYKDVSYIVRLDEYYCTEKKNRHLTATFYSSDGGVIYSLQSPGELRFIVPDSTGEAIFKEVCK